MGRGTINSSCDNSKSEAILYGSFARTMPTPDSSGWRQLDPDTTEVLRGAFPYSLNHDPEQVAKVLPQISEWLGAEVYCHWSRYDQNEGFSGNTFLLIARDRQMYEMPEQLVGFLRDGVSAPPTELNLDALDPAEYSAHTDYISHGYHVVLFKDSPFRAR